MYKAFEKGYGRLRVYWERGLILNSFGDIWVTHTLIFNVKQQLSDSKYGKAEKLTIWVI